MTSTRIRAALALWLVAIVLTGPVALGLLGYVVVAHYRAVSTWRMS